MKRILKYYPGCTTDLEWMRDFQESVRHYWIERFSKGQEQMAQQWEYKRIWFKEKDFDNAMNGHGKDGWECMHVDEVQGIVYAYLKRPLKDEKTLLNE